MSETATVDRGAKLLAILKSISQKSVTPKDFTQAHGPAELKKLLKGGHVTVDGDFLELTPVGRAVLKRLSGTKGRFGNLGRAGWLSRLGHKFKRLRGRYGRT